MITDHPSWLSVLALSGWPPPRTCANAISMSSSWNPVSMPELP